MADLDELFRKLMEGKIRENWQALAFYIERLNGASPLKKLNQGYAYVAGEDGKRLTGAKEAKVGEKLTLYFADGRLFCPCGRKRVRGTEMAEQKEQTLEEIFGEMEGLLEALESREISLEDSFEKYKEGMALLKAAGEKIDTVEKAMLVLNDQGEADEF